MGQEKTNNSTPDTALTIYNGDVTTMIYSDKSGKELIKTIGADTKLNLMLQKQETGFISVDVNKTMIDLIQVSDLLRLAFAGSKGLPCSTPILGMQSDYQDLVKMSMVTTGAFFRASLSAVEYHANAIMMFEEALKPENESSQKDLVNGAMEMLQMCSSVASEMGQHCDTLIEKCDTLIESARNSLLAANDDSTATEKEKKEIERKIAEMEAMQAQLKTKKDEYNLAVEKYDKEQKKLDDKAEKAMWVEFGATILSGITKAAGSVASAAIAVYGGPKAQVAKIAGAAAEGVVVDNSKEKPNEVISSEEVTQTLLENEEDKAKNKAAIENNKKRLTKAEKDLSKEKENVKKLENSKPDAKELDVAKEKVKQFEANIEKNKEEAEKLEVVRKDIEEAGKALSDSLNKVAETAGKRSDSLSERAIAAGDKAYEFRKLKAEIAGELEKTVVTLASLNTNSSTIDKTLASLEVVLAVLGKVKTAFSNTKVFWEGVKAHCESLESGSKSAEMFKNTIKIPAMQNRLMLNVKGSTLSWMSLAHINYRAHAAMKEAGAKVDDAMMNIPGAEECNNIVNTLAPEILNQIRAERIIEN